MAALERRDEAAAKMDSIKVSETSLSIRLVCKTNRTDDLSKVRTIYHNQSEELYSTVRWLNVIDVGGQPHSLVATLALPFFQQFRLDGSEAALQAGQSSRHGTRGRAALSRSVRCGKPQVQKVKAWVCAACAYTAEYPAPSCKKQVRKVLRHCCRVKLSSVCKLVSALSCHFLLSCISRFQLFDTGMIVSCVYCTLTSYWDAMFRPLCMTWCD